MAEVTSSRRPLPSPLPRPSVVSMCTLLHDLPSDDWAYVEFLRLHGAVAWQRFFVAGGRILSGSYGTKRPFIGQ